MHPQHVTAFVPFISQRNLNFFDGQTYTLCPLIPKWPMTTEIYNSKPRGIVFENVGLEA